MACRIIPGTARCRGGPGSLTTNAEKEQEQEEEEEEEEEEEKKKETEEKEEKEERRRGVEGRRKRREEEEKKGGESCPAKSWPCISLKHGIRSCGVGNRRRFGFHRLGKESRGLRATCFDVAFFVSATAFIVTVGAIYGGILVPNHFHR